MRSLDKGLTWSAPIVVSPVQSVGTRDPATEAVVRDGSTLGSIAAGAHGELAVAWQDSRFSGSARDAIAFSRSTDGGLTWSTPTRINREPGVPAFLPTVAIRSDGSFGVSYYDFRSNTGVPTTILTDYWLARSVDGVTWTESRISGPFDLAVAPNAEGLFLGDYQGLTSIGAVFVPFYGQTNSNSATNRTDIFATLASSVGTARALAAQATESGMPSVAAEPMAMTPQLAKKLRDAATAAVRRRMMQGSQPTPQQSP